MNPSPEIPDTQAEGRSFLRRVTGALQLDSPTYNEIASDPAATAQAAIVVAMAAAAQIVASPEALDWSQLPLVLAWQYMSWLFPGTLLWLIGTRVFGLPTELPRVLRCQGFATTPQLLWLLGSLAPQSRPVLLALAATIFLLVVAANVIAIRAAFTVNLMRAIQILLLFAAAGLILGSIFLSVPNPSEAKIPPAPLTLVNSALD